MWKLGQNNSQLTEEAAVAKLFFPTDFSLFFSINGKLSVCDKLGYLLKGPLCNCFPYQLALNKTIDWNLKKGQNMYGFGLELNKLI